MRICRHPPKQTCLGVGRVRVVARCYPQLPRLPARDPAWDDIWRELGAIIGEYQRDAFVEVFGVDVPAKMACIRRLIVGEI